MCQGNSHFSGFLHNFVLTKFATSSIGFKYHRSRQASKENSLLFYFSSFLSPSSLTLRQRQSHQTSGAHLRNELRNSPPGILYCGLITAILTTRHTFLSRPKSFRTNPILWPSQPAACDAETELKTAQQNASTV